MAYGHGLLLIHFLDRFMHIPDTKGECYEQKDIAHFVTILFFEYRDSWDVGLFSSKKSFQ